MPCQCRGEGWDGCDPETQEFERSLALYEAAVDAAFDQDVELAVMSGTARRLLTGVAPEAALLEARIEVVRYFNRQVVDHA